MERVDSVDDRKGVEVSVGIIRVRLVELELHGFWHAGGEVGSRAVREHQVLASALGVGFRIVVLNEAPCAPHHVPPHQVTPVVRIIAFLEGSERVETALMAPFELHFAELANHRFRPDPERLFAFDEKGEL